MRFLSIAIAIFLFMSFIAACSNSQENSTVNETHADPAVAEEKKTEEKPVKEKPKNSEEKSNSPGKTFLTKDEFNKMFNLDPEEKQYENGKFQLKDGSIIYADDLVYGESELFLYATATFYQGKLVHLQVETNKPAEEVFKGLGITPTKDVIVETKDWGDIIVHDITFDKTFEDSNITVFPNEWD
jgi:hypothetical protein